MSFGNNAVKDGVPSSSAALKDIWRWYINSREMVQ